MTEKEKAATVGASALGMGSLKPGTLQVTVGRQVSREDLHSIIDRIAKLHGCTPCGLGGIDIIIRTPDPLIEVFEGISSVRDVAVYR